MNVVDLAKDPDFINLVFIDSVHFKKRPTGALASSTTRMSKRDHSKRLDAEYYCGDAVVHWTTTIRGRKTGWLNLMFLYRFRELLTHSCLRYGFVCPVFCLMPDHCHMLWMGVTEKCNQLHGMKHFRKILNEILKRIGFELQDQAYGHVLTEQERRDAGKCWPNTFCVILSERGLWKVISLLRISSAVA